MNIYTKAVLAVIAALSLSGCQKTVNDSALSKQANDDVISEQTKRETALAVQAALENAEIQARQFKDLESREKAELSAVLRGLSQEKAATIILDSMGKRIKQFWSRPSSDYSGLEAYIRMSLERSGELADVRIVQSSGDVLFDQSVVRAVQRAAPFDEVKHIDARTFDDKFRKITVQFRPED